MREKPPADLIASEEDLCALFIREFNQQPGWTCYPETGGFDVLVVHEDGRQIGVEAKLQLNAKVADQILPSDAWHRYMTEGPDHRLVIVRNITDASAGIARLLEMHGVLVWNVHFHKGWDRQTGEDRWDATFRIREALCSDEHLSEPSRWSSGHASTAMFDWNPPARIALPDAVPTIPAGVPGPVRMTSWKQAAMRVMARLRLQGHITAKEIAQEGCSPSMWTQRWLDRGGVRGQWVETERLPKFDQQHPEQYEAAMAGARARLEQGSDA